MVRLTYISYYLRYFLFIVSFFCSSIECKVKKPWTVLVYAAADNNLRDYASRNLEQMKKIGSNANFNLVVHLDIRLHGSKKMTRRYYVEKNNAAQIDIHEKTPMNSGDPQTLISACTWAFNEYPADHYALILWNHGTGIIDPYGRRQLDTSKLYHYNPATNNYELDRTIGFLDLIEEIETDPRGICWDDSTNDFLTNQKLELALNEITANILKGQKLDIIAFDACLMAMLEVGNITKKYANIQISSQEVEPGMGWRYDEALSLFSHGVPEARHLSTHIVDAFARAYRPLGNYPGFVDYTQSALDLTLLDSIEQNVDQLAQLLIMAIQSDQSVLFKNIIATSRNKKNCTHFNEPTYIDLNHFYSNLLKNLQENITGHNQIAIQLKNILQEGQAIMKKVVIHNVCGSNLPLARGISIFFPERKIHPSYKKANFAQNNWIKFLTAYLLTQ